MIFKHLGASIGLSSSRIDDNAQKPVTLRFPESELGLYDAMAKAMGISRQAFMHSLIRASFEDAMYEFAQGYLEQKPTIPLGTFLLQSSDSEDVSALILDLLKRLEHRFIQSNIADMEAIASGEYDYPFDVSVPSGFYEVKKK